MPVAKPIELSTGHYTKEEIEQRKEAEEKLKGNSDLVYEIPKQLKAKKEKDMYLFLVGELKASNILNNLDINILIQTVNSIFQMEEANKKIKEFGQVIQKKMDHFKRILQSIFIKITIQYFINVVIR